MKRQLTLLAVISGMLGLASLGGCGQRPATESRPPASLGHHHEPPHGGTVVVLGNEEYHLELVHHADEGRLQVFILDGHMDNFVRLKIPSFDLVVREGGNQRNLTLEAVTIKATGEKVGDTALFEARADWLKGLTHFEAELPQLSIRGREYRAVTFPFPQGNAPPDDSTHRH